MSAADDAHRFCQTFEAELLLELMLRYWKHPLADDREFRGALIECATGVLKASIQGEQLLADLPATQMNFVSAVWYSEWVTVEGGQFEIDRNELHKRRQWLEATRQAIPSCFCSQDDLPE